jgi:hypothetical protein
MAQTGERVEIVEIHVTRKQSAKIGLQWLRICLRVGPT